MPAPASVRHRAHPVPALRLRPDRPNHHLWLNNGTWYVAYTIHPTSLTKERVRTSLNTRCVVTARIRRDALFAKLLSNHPSADTGVAESAGRCSAAERNAIVLDGAVDLEVDVGAEPSMAAAVKSAAFIPR